VTEAVADNEKLLFMTEDGGEGESPLDYRTILAGNGVTIPAKTAPLNTTEGRRFPITGAPAGSLSRARFPVAALNGKLLYLSGDGPVIRQADNEGAPVSIFLPLVIDACFVDDRTIITVSARAAGGSLLQLVNIATGETVPLEMPGLITLKVQRGTSGDVYAAVTGMSGGPVRILRLDLEYPSRSRRILERGDGGDDFSFAESGNALVTNLGSRTADFYARDRGYALFHGSRLPAFPVRILDAGRDVIIIDDEGSIIWLNAQNGQLEAVLRLYDGEWELRAANGEHAQGR
jgi:hypothetical protein